MLAADSDIHEILQTLERVQALLDDLVVRGLRTAAPEQIKSLDVMQEQFERMGAAHLAGKLKTVVEALRNEDPAGAKAVMTAQASLRLYERLLTLENATAALSAFIEAPDAAANGADMFDGNDDKDEDDDA